MAFEYLYTSAMAPTADLRSIAGIARRSRSFNFINDLTGILVFDGRHFCQYTEGDQETVLWLMGRVREDPRHQAFTIIRQGQGEPQRRFSGWTYAYAMDIHVALLDAFMQLPPSNALRFLLQRVPGLIVQS